MSTQDVSWRVDSHIGIITLDRPPVNALRTQTWEELEQAFAALAADVDVRVAVLRSGSDRIFSAGADVKELPMPREVDERRQRLSRAVLEQLLHFPVPVICAVSGPALGGGCALACVSDIRIATTSASFGLPEINVGRAGGGRFLMRVLPQGVVRRAYFTGEPVPAEDAWRLGMVSEVVSKVEELDAATMSLAHEIAAKSPTAVRLAKQALDLAETLPMESGYEVEQQFSLRLAVTPDAVEAAEAFRDKREPKWVEP